jgi:hypothetical protein
LVGEYIDSAKTEPLHLKNNVTKELFMKLFRIVVSGSDLKNIRVYSDVSPDSLFFKFIDFLRSKMGCNFLSKKLITWFNESSLTFRFRGQESLAYIKHFQSLIFMLLSNITNDELKIKIHQMFYCSLLLRRVISYSVRIEDFDNNMQIQLENNASPLFKACCLFYPRLSVSLWVLTNVLSLFMLLKLYVYTDMVLVVIQWKPANKSTSKSQSRVITLPFKIAGL